MAMPMPKRNEGEATRVVSFRLAESLAEAVEARAKRAGRSLGDEVRAVCEGTFRYPGKVYTWAESKEREKALKQVSIWIDRATTLRGERDAPCRLLGAIRDASALTPELRAKIDEVLNA